MCITDANCASWPLERFSNSNSYQQLDKAVLWDGVDRLLRYLHANTYPLKVRIVISQGTSKSRERTPILRRTASQFSGWSCMLLEMSKSHTHTYARHSLSEFMTGAIWSGTASRARTWASWRHHDTVWLKKKRLPPQHPTWSCSSTRALLRLLPMGIMCIHFMDDTWVLKWLQSDTLSQNIHACRA